MIKLKSLLLEKTVRLSTMKDANFEPGKFVQILGRKGKVKLDKKDVKFLAKWIRQNSGKHGMGWSFTENKEDIDEKCWKGYEKKGMKKMFGKMYPNCVKKKKRKSEGKLAEGKKLRLPGGVEATIDFKGIKLQQKGKKPVFLDRNELLNFFRATTKYLRYT